MAIQKKKARSIELDKRQYSWCASQRGVVGDLNITCQHASGQGAILLVKIRHTNPWYRISVETGEGEKVKLPPNELLAATPAFVKSAILFGLSVGWRPLSNGNPVVLRFQGGSFFLEQLVPVSGK
jgi:hypothetical protein